MVQTTTKFRFRFDDKQMVFEESYPEELSAVFPIEEFNAIIRKLNYDLNLPIQQSSSTLKRWTAGTGIACCFIVGIFAIPVLWYKASVNEREMNEYWTRVREYLTEINRRSLIRRGLEWKVVEDKAKIKGHDCVNKVYCYRLDLLWRQGIVKSKKALEREARRRGMVQEDDSNTSSSSTSGSAGAVGGAMPKRSSLRKSRPLSNIEPVPEASVAEEMGQTQPSPITSPPAEDQLGNSPAPPENEPIEGQEAPLEVSSEAIEEPEPLGSPLVEEGTATSPIAQPSSQEPPVPKTGDASSNFLDLSE